MNSLKFIYWKFYIIFTIIDNNKTMSNNNTHTNTSNNNKYE